EHPDGAAGGPDQVEQQPDRGGLPGAVGAQEPVHLAGVDPQVEAGQTAVAAVVLDQVLGADRRLRHRCPPLASARGIRAGTGPAAWAPRARRTGRNPGWYAAAGPVASTRRRAAPARAPSGGAPSRTARRPGTRTR